MKPLAFIVLLCSWLTACSQDTETVEKWPRTVEARLTNATWQRCKKALRPGHVVEEATCGPVTAPIEESCPGIIDTHEQALRVLTSPSCIDRAIEALERFARVDPSILSDVAAAYSVRARQEDHAPDLLRALDAAERAIAARPRNEAAWFNRALVEEAIGLRAQAIASWNHVLEIDDSDWATEARERRDRLVRERDDDAAAQWTRNRIEIRRALDRRDGAAIARLIARFPRRAVQFFEEELLTQDETEVLHLYASKLSERLSNDPYFLEIAAAASRNRKGHDLFRKARLAQSNLQWKDAADAYANASDLLRRGGSPLHLEAELGRAICLSNLSNTGGVRAESLISVVGIEARRRKSRYLIADAAAARGYIHYRRSFIESIAALDEACVLYEQLADGERLASLHRTNIGTYSDMGQYDLAFREALRAQRYLPRAVELRIRHTVNAETARAVMGLGFPHVALLYQQSAIDSIQRGTASITDKNRQLATALRARANFELELGDFDAARQSYAESNRRSKAIAGDASDRKTLAALLGEVKGRALLPFDPAAAAAAFEETLSFVDADERWTFRASLLSQKAKALKLAGRDRESEEALRQSLAELRTEEQRLLDVRKRGEAEEIWSAYFARFRETHNELIRQLVENDRHGEAFAEAERSRAIEPLDLARKLDVAPPEFLELTERGSPIELEAIQAKLPAGTFLLQYSVIAEQTYVWIVSRDHVRFLQMAVTAGDVDRWRDVLQQAGRRRDARAFDAGSYAPFERLISEPLAIVRSLPGGEKARLVIIPDVAMQGLPFAALRDPVSRRYLIEYAPIEIAGSATLYVFSLMRAEALQDGTTHSVLLVGDPAFDEQLSISQGLKRLPGAKAEVERIRELYASGVDVLNGAEATVARFIELARNKTIVHFASHSIVNPRRPTQSLLLLAKTPEDLGVLEAGDLLNLNFDRTRLVVLSACSSAGGFPVGPEGVAPLVRPLIAAGVPAVIGSLWDVEDATAEQLFVSFHRHYRQNGDAAAALRAAQLSLLGKNRGLRSVLVWAPYQVIGH